MASEVPWENVWERVANQLNSYCDVGLDGLLTEDVVRFSTVQQLVEAGISPADLEVEWRRPGVPDAVDVVHLGTPRAALEFKYPREPRETNAAWTQHLGEALKDLYRLATMPSDFETRWCVQLLSMRVLRYLDGVNARHGLRFGLSTGTSTVLEPALVRALPATAHKGLGRWLPDLPLVEARCIWVHPVGQELRLVLHSVRETRAMPGGI
jgi:hypothetical protein